MNLKPEQLPSHLDQGLKKVYLVSGDELLLCQEAVSSICEQAKSQGYSEKSHCLLEKESDIQSFAEHGATRSLFANKRILSLQLINTSLASRVAKVLEKIIDRLDDNTLLIVNAPKLSPATQRSSWVKSIEKSGVWIQVWQMNDSQFSAWLHRRLRGYGASIETDAMTMLAEMCSGNLLAADQQAKKLALMYKDKLITTEMLCQNGTDNSRFDIFQIIDFAMLANTSKLIHGFSRFSNQDKFKANELLYSIQAQLRQLLTLSEYRDLGENFRVACQKMRLWPAREKIFAQVLQRINSRTILTLLRFCARIDQQMRGVRATSSLEASLLALLLAIAEKKTPQLNELIIEQLTDKTI